MKKYLMTGVAAIAFAATFTSCSNGIEQYTQEEITEKLKQAHKKYPSHGYHRLARDIKDKLDYYVSDNLVHLCCKSAGIFSS